MPTKKPSQATIPTLIGVLFLILGIVAGILIVQNQQTFRSRADEIYGPKNVVVTNLTDSSFVVSWTTDTNTDGSVAWGESEKSLDNITDVSESSTTHHVEVVGLEPNSKYYFRVYSDDKPYSNNSDPWDTTTGLILPSPTSTGIVSGSVVSENGVPVINAIVYLSTEGGSVRSTTTSGNGRWIIPLSEIRNVSLTSYLNLENTSILNINATDGKLTSNAIIDLGSAKPVPDMILGQNHDFTNNETGSSGFQNPENTLEIQNEQNSSRTESKELDEEDKSDDSSDEEVVVTIDSVEDEQVVDETLPEFYGTGTPNLEITITVESDPVTETLTIGSDGSWNWLPPLELEPGIHTVTVSYLDVDGILQTVQKQFEVQASEGNTSSSISPSPTLKPSPTPTLIPTATPTPTPNNTEDAKLPNSGFSENTLILIGFFLLAIGGMSFILLI